MLSLAFFFADLLSKNFILFVIILRSSLIKQEAQRKKGINKRISCHLKMLCEGDGT